jgi:A/G-specific adenine glycosylase
MQAAVLGWFEATARPLAFRGTTDPYAILVSELMAQQTQAARAADAWRGFLRTFPTFADLAAASPAAVIRAWRGLGYNRRALALRQIAVAVVAEHGGRLPDDLAALRRLPGIGPYTARAIAALAFGRTVGPIDTNVRRVLRRALLGLEPGPAAYARAGAEGPSSRELQRLADAAVPAGRAATWTHALMDLGATVCRARSPRCEACPIRPWCRAVRIRGDLAVGSHTAVSPTIRPAADPPRRAAERALPFASTSRWLRGRIVERLCDAPDGEWVKLPDRIGGHRGDAVAQAMEGLRRDGLAELHPSLARHARLPVA